MDGIDINGTSFSVLMDQAVKIKTATLASSRKYYDSLPSFLQSSIFVTDEVINARNNNDFNGRIKAAMAIKDDGNAAYREGRYDDAMRQYQISLHIFRYLDNRNPDVHSIKDECLSEVMYAPTNNIEGQQQQLDQFLVTIYNNIALTMLKTNEYQTAIQACDYALEIDNKNDKTLYLRASARLAPKNANVTDEEFAMRDLRSAVMNNPNNKQARDKLKDLMARIKLHRAKEKNEFAGLFSRGEIYDTQELHEEKEARKNGRRGQDKDQDILIARELAHMYGERGMVEEKAKIDECLESLNHANEFNFRNPSAKMMRDAKAMGVDLADPRTVELLEGMQEERIQGNDMCKDSSIQIQAPITRKYSTLVRGAIMLCVILFVYNRLINSFLLRMIHG